ncbi:mitochondrial import receptor subunit TOM70-like isoform X2 [Dreissena polymorpha]|uniref:mitochondrial import receptor subunit TOM70-like isoform X2 n=1 Tax=Dreissena polymorpha TaxID=45954 RepID=UPI0022644333|nr:mitochondrial import receptor subunit TOM70-like isoform X2 [Dreissena polymorpha]
MAPTTDSVSSIFEGWEKWQIALAVGAPIGLGLAGLWFYSRSKQPGGNDNANSKPKVDEIRPTKVNTTETAPFPAPGVPRAAEKSTLDKSKSDPLAKAVEMKELGNKAFKNGKYDEAIKFYTQAIEQCPPERENDLSTFYANRAAAYEKLKSPRQVIDNCTEAIKLNGRYLKAINRRAQAAEEIGELQMSLEDATAVCMLEGFQNPHTLTMADRVLKALGKEKAKAELKKKKKCMPSKHFIKSYFASFTQDPVQSIGKENTVEEEKILNIPTPDDSGQQTGSIPEENGHVSGEVSETGDNQPNNHDDQSTPVANLVTCKSVFRKAVQCLKEGDYEHIIPLCTDEICITPPTHFQQLALLLRGTMFQLTAQPTAAFADFEQLLAVENLDKKIKVNVLIKRGSLYISLDQRVEGMNDFAHATRVDPSNSDVYHHRGHQNIQIDRLEDAIKDFDHSISKNPDFPNAYVQKSYAEHRRAAAEQSTTKLEQAIKSYEKLLKKFPNNADGHALYAQALCDLGRFEEAHSEFETAIRLDPDNANSLVQKALLTLQWKQTDIKEPVSLIKEAIKLDSKCEYAYEILGTIEVQKGDMVGAMRHFEVAIELCRTEAELSHLFSLLHAAKAQLKAAEMLGIPLPKDFSPM